MRSFKLTLFKGHPIIKDEDNIILIDTGAPSTIHKSTNLSFISLNYECPVNYMGLTVNTISKMLGMEITTLLGSDILANYIIAFDYKNEIVQFSEEDFTDDGNEISLSSFMGIPIIELDINNQNLKFFLDTGAKLSYLSNSLTSNYCSIGKEEDFYPGVGKFETQCYEIMTNIENENFNVKYGNLPTLLQMTLKLGGTDGIIGYDFFNTFQVLLDLKNNRLKYVRQPF